MSTKDKKPDLQEVLMHAPGFFELVIEVRR
ncbi:MAG: hypothetical protein ACI8SK_001536 [Shewanella sp.]|jgi:hypothetical protein